MTRRLSWVGPVRNLIFVRSMEHIRQTAAYASKSADICIGRQTAAICSVRMNSIKNRFPLVKVADHVALAGAPALVPKNRGIDELEDIQTGAHTVPCYGGCLVSHVDK